MKEENNNIKKTMCRSLPRKTEVDYSQFLEDEQRKENKPVMIKQQKKQEERALFINNNVERSLCDLILVNLLIIVAVAISAFVPIFSFALPILVYIYLSVGVWGYVLNKELEKETKFESIFVSLKHYVRFFCMFVVKTIIILFGLVLFIIPGIVFALQYAFTGAILYESPELDVKGALMLSKELTCGYRLQILFYFLLAMASVALATTLVFLIVLLFDYFLVVSAAIYLVFVLLAVFVSTIVLAIPIIQFAIVDCYIMAKDKKIRV